MKEELKKLHTEALERINNASFAELKDIEVEYIGRKGKLTGILRGLADLSVEEKKEFGAEANRVKGEIIAALADKVSSAEQKNFSALADQEWVDVTYSALKNAPHGKMHPISKMVKELEDVFVSMGFEILEGPHIDEEKYNFDVLNIPPDHPARDHQDTFWLGDGRVLRSHTSNVWAHALQDREFPLRGVSMGRVYRNEALDASHEHTFHQFEGFYVDKEVSVVNMIACLRTMLSRIFQREVKVRLRPGYFPFVEPGFELDFSCGVCDGKGCPACKHVGWIELLGCGMIHPNVFKACGKDPEEWNGFAWGGGVERLIMMKYKIADLRLFTENDLRFLDQF